MMFGGGGFDGSIPPSPGTRYRRNRQGPLGRGYATFGSDSGHQAGP